MSICFNKQKTFVKEVPTFLNERDTAHLSLKNSSLELFHMNAILMEMDNALPLRKTKLHIQSFKKAKE